MQSEIATRKDPEKPQCSDPKSNLGAAAEGASFYFDLQFHPASSSSWRAAPPFSQTAFHAHATAPLLYNCTSTGTTSSTSSTSTGTTGTVLPPVIARVLVLY
jgi:hypothetical protein